MYNMMYSWDKDYIQYRVRLNWKKMSYTSTLFICTWLIKLSNLFNSDMEIEYSKDKQYLIFEDG